MVPISYISLRDQLASMLGAEGVYDLPKVDQDRIGIFVNQAYRECYAPVDNKRAMWAQQEFKLDFDSEKNFSELPPEVVSVDKIPVLEGEGPLSPMTGPEAEIRARAIFSSDFRAPSGRGLNFPNFKDNEPEVGRPIWYYLDNRSKDFDTKVVPRVYLYPHPDKEYTVTLYANIVPKPLEDDFDEPRLPSDLVWDILFPIAQGKIVTDPRYNGANKEFLIRNAEEAKKRLRNYISPQKHKGSLRLTKRVGY